MQKIKVIIVIVGLLLIGFVGGFLTNRHLVETKVRHFRQLERGRDFGAHFLDRIEADDEQRARLRPTLEDYGRRFRALGRTHQIERAGLTDSLFQAISPSLEDRQLEHARRWRRFLERGPEKSPRKRREGGASSSSDNH